MKTKAALLAVSLAFAPFAATTPASAVVVGVRVGAPGHYCGWHHRCWRYRWHGGYYNYYWHGHYWHERRHCHRHWCYR
jgi:hypothetical protein